MAMVQSWLSGSHKKSLWGPPSQLLSSAHGAGGPWTLLISSCSSLPDDNAIQASKGLSDPSLWFLWILQHHKSFQQSQYVKIGINQRTLKKNFCDQNWYCKTTQQTLVSQSWFLEPLKYDQHWSICLTCPASCKVLLKQPNMVAIPSVCMRKLRPGNIQIKGSKLQSWRGVSLSFKSSLVWFQNQCLFFFFR